MRQRYHAWMWWTSKWGVKLDQTYSRQSALISQSPLWYPALGKPPLHLVGLKQKRQEASTVAPLSLPIFLSFFTHTHTHIHNPHPHWTLFWKSMAWFKIPLQSVSCILYAWRVGERGGIAWGSSPNDLPSAVGLLGDITIHTTTTTFFDSSPHIFPHPLNSFNISFTASCFPQITPSSESAVAFEDKCDQNWGRGCKKPGRRAFGFLHLCLAGYGAEDRGWQVRCLGTALMFDGVRLLLLLLQHSLSQEDSHIDTTYTVQYVTVDR